MGINTTPVASPLGGSDQTTQGNESKNTFTLITRLFGGPSPKKNAKNRSTKTQELRSTDPDGYFLSLRSLWSRLLTVRQRLLSPKPTFRVSKKSQSLGDFCPSLHGVMKYDTGPQTSCTNLFQGNPSKLRPYICIVGSPKKKMGI